MTGEPFSWGTFSDDFVDELAAHIGSARVLEVFAGNGLLASKLAARGIDILATTIFSGHDAHDRGMHHPVTEMRALEAVRVHGAERDVLLMCWPTSTEAATACALEWGHERRLIFIGEISRPELGFAGLGGCASDLFFELTIETARFGSYPSRNELEAAVIRHLDPVAVAAWRAAPEETTPFGFGR